MATMADRIEAAWQELHPAAGNVMAQAYYDPHYIGFNNQHYTLQPTKRAILFSNTLDDFQMNAMHDSVYPGSRTVINGLEIRIKSQIITYTGNNNTFLVNDQPAAFHNNWAFLSETQTAIVKINAYTNYIYTAGGPKLTIYNSRGYNLNVTLTVPRQLAIAAVPSLFGNLPRGHAKIIPA